MNILLTNDDGIQAVGLRALYAACREAGHTVSVVAPLTEQSAVGHSLTVFQPLRTKAVTEKDFNGTGVFGTPTDCVKLALNRLLPCTPDIVISGINAGANVGPDILYSGTVAAATEAAHSGIPAFAVSYDNFHPENIMPQARHAVHLATSMDFRLVPPRCVLNLNFPHASMDETRPLRVCPQTTALWKDEYVEHRDPRGNPYWWMSGHIPAEQVNAGSDRALLTRGHMVLTPLLFEFTATACLVPLAEWAELH
ncbi:MAG: 5'/3'-nucleotidase SurE [Desulfovibrionaceae bacterium]